MRKSLLILLLIIVCSCLISCGSGSNGGGSKKNSGTSVRDGSYTIRADHPRVFLTPESRFRTSDPDYLVLKNYVSRTKRDYSETDIKNKLLLSPQGLIMSACIEVLAEPNKTDCLQKVKEWVEHVRNLPNNFGEINGTKDDDTKQRSRLSALAIAYDWLYDKYSVTERKVLAERIIEYIQFLDGQYGYISRPNFVTGHSRGCNIVCLQAVLALYGEDERYNTTVKRYLDQILTNWINNPSGYQYILDRVGAGGGHYMGWRYGASYASPLFSLMWYTATSTPTRPGQLLGERYYYDAPYFYIYGTDPFKYPFPNDLKNKPGTLPSFGNCWDLKPGSEISEILAFSSGVLKNGLAEWYQKKYFENYLHDGARAFRVIMKTFNSSQGATHPTSLPLARQFSGSGFAVARNTWEDTSDPANPSFYPTIMVFKCTPFLVYGHDHADQNTLTINYKGPLLIDSGTYQTANDDHWNQVYWRNYYSQTIAHNGLLVDGQGQTTPVEVEKTLKYRMTDGIKRFAEKSPKGVWIQGEATGAYGSTVNKYIRDVLMAYKPKGLNHSALLVVDRVGMQGNHIPKVLWQVRQEPNITSSNSALIKNGFGGCARLEFFSDKEISLSSVSISPRDDSKGKGVAGWGRLETATTASVSNARILTLIVVGDESEDSLSGLAKGKYIYRTDWVGVVIKNTLLIVADSSKEISAINLSAAEGTGVQEIYVAGMSDGNCKISIGTQERTVSVMNGFGHLML